jgi:hypothetical protein
MSKLQWEILLPHVDYYWKHKSITNTGEDVEKKELMYIVDGNVNSTHHGEQYVHSSKN